MDSIKTFLLIYIVLIVEHESEVHSFQVVQNWTDFIGKELWELTNVVAKPNEIKQQYKIRNTKVTKKSGEDIINTISANMGLMLKTKVDAVNCIRFAAEDIIKNWVQQDDYNYTYTSAKFSQLDVENNRTYKNISVTYREMELNKLDYFTHIPVNINYTSVHVPSNVHDLDPKVANDIMWSEGLEDIFRNNYKRDPALSWQYFGSKNGILRIYPALDWDYILPVERPVDQYDCRLRSWFIEASTCSKDVVILIDNSGSMTGMSRTIASTTMASILQTLSNNDLLAVYNYSRTTQELVSCYKDKLVPATQENLEKFMSLVPEMVPEGQANLTEAFGMAFGILQKYREIRGCGEGNPCNQIIMLITDGVPGNLTEVFKQWNWVENTTSPVRVFTYLLGNEVTNVREIQWMACLNRGYYSHVHNQEEVREQVLKYIPVMARPLVLQSTENPVIWTHVYADLVTRKECGQNPSSIVNCEKYKMITTVGVPVFDKTVYETGTRTAHLLGVAGTDVMIKDIRRLTLSYKLGVNGYGFIVSNNGYIIMHPALSPTFDNKLKPNFKSVDISEVEILYDSKGFRVHGENILKLRQSLVDHEKGNLTDIKVKLHYDDSQRVTIETRNYYYTPLPGTPFGLAIALPKYGRNIINIGDEIDRNHKLNISITKLFEGTSWRVHPEWAYCRYHYPDYQIFKSPEDQTRHFVDMLDDWNWRWSDQYEHFKQKTITNTTKKSICEIKTLNRDDYYCDKDLMQMLVFDAQVTKLTYDRKYNIAKQPYLAKLYKVLVRFVATHSGLTRWQKVNEAFMPEEMRSFEFGDLYKRTINEPWYKGAILQHVMDPESVYITVSNKGMSEYVVTAAIAIFAHDEGRETPVAVVGYQMPVDSFYTRFLQITSVSKDKRMNCENDFINCYLIDHNGYVVLSKTRNDTGSFFGIIDGGVMTSLVGQNVFEAVEIYDYQAICIRTVTEGGAMTLLNPMVYLNRMISWTLLKLTWYFMQFIYLPVVTGKVHVDEDAPDPPPPPIEVHYPYACDKKRTLYVMDQKIADRGHKEVPEFCSRPFYSQRVVHTNLLFVAVDTSHPSCYGRLDVAPVMVPPSEYSDNETDRTCMKFNLLNDLPRRRPKACFTEHPLEEEITACGRASEQLLAFGTLVLVGLNVLIYL